VTRCDCENIAQNVAQPFFSKLMHHFFIEKVPQKFALLAFVITKKLPSVNNRPMGENSPNLFTLSAYPAQLFSTALKQARTLYILMTSRRGAVASHPPQLQFESRHQRRLRQDGKWSKYIGMYVEAVKPGLPNGIFSNRKSHFG
jgi:hypothetical protein